MRQFFLKQFSLIIAIISWATLVGGIQYSHIVFMPGYLSHLPESTKIITDFGIHDENFWMIVHPVAILSSIVTLIFNWKHKTRRKYILAAVTIYALAIIATAVYFLPALAAFADSMNSPVSASEWYRRGQTWQQLSWIRGTSIVVGFIFLLIALTKNNNE